jgi:uncharacterized protein
MGVSVLTIDDDARKVSFKIGNGRSLPKGPITLGTGGPVTTDKLEEAVKRYAKSLLTKNSSFESAYPAIDAFLLRKLPTITSVKVGNEIITGHAEINKIVDTAVHMDSTYLFLQGPPGAGKTYSGSEIILKMIQENKKIGVTSNSHKAINNLLKEVDRKSVERGMVFTGYKYSSSGDEDQTINGQNIKDTKRAEDCIGSRASLVAGTAWLFAREEFDQKLDYIFIDEAGQISLAHLIAIGCTAKNIVLLGDQMQLSQPIQGTHPDNSGVSSLDYLLEGKATIPPVQGIFLQNTWRMHPAICEFISSAVYEGRLLSHQKTETRYLELDSNADSALLPVGIRFEPVAHEGCAQYSQEEVTRVKALYENLLTQSYMDDDGQKKPLQEHNILVVSPYNMQVILLKQALPPFARVGTVDKFQGQEAEVVIVSMATSSGDELPRNIEFLFSKNRLNVAISRAKCLAVLVSSPDLLSIQCKTPEQMRLVNTLAWVAV